MANYKKKSDNALLLADRMRKSVLQAAIEGKLTQQDPKADGDARDLLAQIQAEKQRLIAAGEVKREKTLPAIDENDVPFDIPDNWVWVRLGDVVKVNPRNRAKDDIEVAFMPMAMLDGEYKNSFKFDVKKWSEIKQGFTHFAENDVVFAKITPCFQNRKSAIIKDIPNKIGAGTTELHVLRTYANHIELKYLLYFVKNPSFIQDGVATFTGTAGQQRISTDFVKEYLFPLPPLAEQRRIVEKLDKILPQLEQLQADENELHALQVAFPSCMQASLLQAAIEGKLTQQDPKADGDARDLLAQIQAEKQRLIDAKEIKREKTLPDITDDEIPFDIPDNWVWVRLGDISLIQTGSTPSKNDKSNYGTEFPFFKPSDLSQEMNIIEASEYLSVKGKIKARVAKANSILVNGIGKIGKVGLLRTDGAFNQQMHSITPYIESMSLLIYYFIQAEFVQETMKTSSSQTTLPILNKSKFESLIIPLPPLAEQRRIVAKLDEILPKVHTLNDL